MRIRSNTEEELCRIDPIEFATEKSIVEGDGAPLAS
jgi:hypothetical protein